MTNSMGTTTRFVGAIPELYDRHMGPVLFEPYARELARRIPAGTRRILEVAAGTGRVTRHLLAALPEGGELLATDLNEPMIVQGRRAVGDDPRLAWQVADVQALPVPDHGFDVVACQFGLMFVPDKPLALREMRRALRPGGTLLLSTWDALERNPATKVLHEHAMALLPDDPPLFMLTPFSMPDPAALRALVAAAGFTSVQVDTVAHTGEAVSAADLATGFVRGNPLWNQLVERGVDAAGFERTISEALIQRFGDRPCRSPLSAHLVSALA